MPTKEELIAQNKWDIFKDKPYENRAVQASQHSTFFRSVQTLGDVEKDGTTSGQSKTGPTSQGSGSTGRRSEDEIQIIKEAFCVVEEMVKYLETRGHHLSHAHAVGKLYLDKTRPLIS